MYGVLRQYKADPGSIDEIVRRATAGFVPLMSAAPGFVSYTMVDLGPAGLLTHSTFEDQAGAEESVGMAASWVKENLATLLPEAPQVTSGPYPIRQVNADAHFGYGVMRRYTVAPGDVAEITQRVTAGLVPILSGAPGFASYAVIDAGNGVVVSLSAFADQATADAATETTRQWVMDNLADLAPTPPTITAGPMRLRHATVAAAAR